MKCRLNKIQIFKSNDYFSSSSNLSSLGVIDKKKLESVYFSFAWISLKFSIMIIIEFLTLDVLKKYLYIYTTVTNRLSLEKNIGKSI